MTETTGTEKTYADILAGHKNKTVREMWDQVLKEAAPLAEIQEKVKAASPPPVSELDKQLAESDDPEVKEFREQIERLESQLRTAREDAHKHLLKGYNTISEEEMDKLNTDYAVKATRVRKAVGMLRDYGEIMSVDGVVEAIDQYRIPNLRGGATRGRSNLENGGPRPKVSECTIVRADEKVKTGQQISVLAPWAKLQTADIYSAWFQKAGTTTWQDIHETYTFEVGDCEVTIVPKVSDSEE